MIDKVFLLEMPLYKEQHYVVLEKYPSLFTDGATHHWLPLQIIVQKQLSKHSSELLDFYNDSLHADVLKNEIKINSINNNGDIIESFCLYNCRLIPNKDNLSYSYKIDNLKFELEFGWCKLDAL
jgi:hypothetical protein